MYRYLLARIYYMWGSLHRNFGNRSSFRREHRAAIKRFTQAYETDPSLREARLDRGILLYREMGLLDEAMADFDALLSDDPHYGPALLNRAMVAQESGRYPQALADLETYLALPSGDDEYRAMAERTTHVLREIVAELPGATVGNEREA
ncbi:MAG TPA: tetratricopeptide repeat protein [Anaerolineae bacterium]|jgi:tetratricopeptide (TPR) repeat protein|nr:tetratricopeptide repeat protein [Anaerolineae bacterium]